VKSNIVIYYNLNKLTYIYLLTYSMCTMDHTENNAICFQKYPVTKHCISNLHCRFSLFNRKLSTVSFNCITLLSHGNPLKLLTYIQRLATLNCFRYSDKCHIQYMLLSVLATLTFRQS